MCKSSLFCRVRCILSILQAALMTLQAVNAWKKESGSVYGFPRCGGSSGKRGARWTHTGRPVWFQQTSSQMFSSFVFCLYRVILTLFLARLLTYEVNPGPHCSLLWRAYQAVDSKIRLWRGSSLPWLSLIKPLMLNACGKPHMKKHTHKLNIHIFTSHRPGAACTHNNKTTLLSTSVHFIQEHVNNREEQETEMCLLKESIA